MIAVIKGDIIASRRVDSAETWLEPLKKCLSLWGKSPKRWELVWGDSFQLEVKDPVDALRIALQLKAALRKIEIPKRTRKTNAIDVRLAIGIGEKTYSASKISQSNGPAFIHAGERFDQLKKENRTLAIQSPWLDFDEEINLYLKLAAVFMDKWSISSAELVDIVLRRPEITQEEIGKKLGIRQNSVSGRWNRAYMDELLAVEKAFRKKIKSKL